LGNYAHIKHFLDFRGLDLRQSDILTPAGYAKLADNSAHAPKGGLTSRRGAKIAYESNALLSKFGYGTFRLDTTDSLGGRKTELVVMGQSQLFRVTRSYFALVNTTGAAITVSMYYDETAGEFLFRITGPSSTLVSQSLGIGTEASPVTIFSLKAVVDAVPGLSMSTPATTPAAFIDLVPDITVANGETKPLYYTILTEIPAAANLVPANDSIEMGLDTFEPTSGAVINGVLYLSSGTNVVKTQGSKTTSALCMITKYDGLRWYRAGMRRGFGQASGAGVSPGTYTDAKGTFARVGLTSDYLQYQITYKHIDKVGNVTENLYVETEITLDGSGYSNETVQVGLADPVGLNLYESGYKTARATVNGAQASVLTLTVDSDNILTVGDIAYFWDYNQTRFIQREVTGITSTSVTLSSASLDSNSVSPNYDAGGAVSVRDNALLSANLRICIWRKKVADSVWILAAEIPYAPETIANYSYYYDEDIDIGTFGAEYVEPQYPYMDGCPQGRYVCSFNNQLIISGNDRRAATTWFSDIISPELFPESTHEFDVSTRVTGCRQTAEVLCVSEANDLNVVAGNLADLNFRVDRIGANIGCISHHSMVEVQEGVMPFLSRKGPYVLAGGRNLEPLGSATYADGIKVSRLEPFFSTVYDQTLSHPVFNRAIAGVLPNKSLYVLFIPYEDAAAYGFANSDSVAFVYDYSRGSWFKWTGVNMAGGIASFEETLWWTGRDYDGSGSYDVNNTRNWLWQFQDELKGKYAYGDHDAAINWDYRSAWDHLGNPALFKRFLRCRVSSLETRPAASVPFTLSTYVDFDESLLSYSTDITWTTQSNIKVKIKAETCRALQVRFNQAVRYNPMIISGYELEATASFRAEFRE
jgi:hypothetical protein